MAGPLSGYRIVDLTAVVSGPLATMLLADQGADVVKIENPAGGDFTRAVSNRRGGFSASFLNNNRNKRSVAIDLKDERGLEIVKRLIAGADVLVQNFRPGWSSAWASARSRSARSRRASSTCRSAGSAIAALTRAWRCTIR